MVGKDCDKGSFLPFFLCIHFIPVEPCTCGNSTACTYEGQGVTSQRVKCPASVGMVTGVTARQEIM